MVGLIILGVIVAIIAAIMLVPVGADVSYIDGELKVSAKVCGILLQLIPKQPVDEMAQKHKKPKKEKKKKPPKPEDPNKPPKKKMNLNFNRDELLALVNAALKGLGKFGKITVDRFLLHFVSGGNDPYNTAMTYNYVNAALSSLAPFCKTRFIVKDADVWTDVDFTADKMNIDFALCIVIRIGQAARAGLAVAFGALKILIRNKLRLRKERRQAAKEAQNPVQNSEEQGINIESNNINTDKNTQDNERNDNNGE